MKNNRILFSLLTALVMLLGCLCPTAAAHPQQAVIDVLLVFDKTAQESLRKPLGKHIPAMTEEQVALLAISQLNTILDNSGIGDRVRFNAAGIFKANYRTQAGEGGKENIKDILALVSPDVIPGLHEAKENVKADLVIMFTNYPIPANGGFTAGGATPIRLSITHKHPNQEAFMVEQCASFHIATIRTGDTTFSHETCHLLGAGHSDYQLAQCGPQSELDAAGTYTEDQAYCTLMSYGSTWIDPRDHIVRLNDDGSIRPKRCQTLEVLSGPAPFSYKGMEYKIGDENRHNNTAVVLRHASAVSMFNHSGQEKIVNDYFDQALPIPALIPYNEKYEHLITRSQSYDTFNLLYHRYAINTVLQEMEIDLDRISQKKLNKLVPQIYAYTKKLVGDEIWPNREDIRLVFANYEQKKSPDTYALAPELETEDMRNTYTSCLLSTNTGAGREAGEPELPGGCGSTVWYKVTTPVPGDLEVGVRRSQTVGDIAPVLGVFRGSELSKLKQLPQQEVADTMSAHFLRRIKVNVDANETLYIAVDSKENTPATFGLMVRLTKGVCTNPPTPEEEEEPEPTPGEPDADDKPAEPGAEDTPAEPGTDDKPAQPGADDKPEPPAEEHAKKEWTALELALLSGVGIFLIVFLTLIGVLLKKDNKPQPPTGKGNVWSQPPAAPADNDVPPPPSDEDTPTVQEKPHTTPTLCLRGTLMDGRKVEYRVKVTDIAGKHNYYIGRTQANDLCIADGSVSSRHAMFKLRRKADNSSILLIADAGSTNGTIVDGVRLNVNEGVHLHNGAKITMGNCHFTVTIEKL